MSNRIKKSGMLRARCDETLKNDVIMVAQFQQLDEADIIRRACHGYVQQFKSLNVNPAHAPQLFAARA